MSAIPVIDLGLVDSKSAVLEGEIKTSIIQALENVGFMYLVGHGIAQQTIDRVVQLARYFFGLPEEVKQELARHAFNEANSNMYKGYHPLDNTPSNKKEGTGDN